jgi:hypothetical protein
LRDSVNQGRQLGQVRRHCSVFTGAEFAIKIPKIHPLRQGSAAFTLDVFSDLVFGRFEQALGVFARYSEGKRFFSWKSLANGGLQRR